MKQLEKVEKDTLRRVTSAAGHLMNSSAPSTSAIFATKSDVGAV